MSWQRCSYFLSSETLGAEYGNTLHRPLPVQPISFPVIFPARGPVLVPATKLTPLPINPPQGGGEADQALGLALWQHVQVTVVTAEMRFTGRRRASSFLFF